MFSKRTDILLYDEWINIRLVPTISRSFYDHKYKRIVINKLDYNILVHEITHAVYAQKHDLIVSKINANSPHKGQPVDLFNEFMAMFMQIYSQEIHDWAERVFMIFK